MKIKVSPRKTKTPLALTIGQFIDAVEKNGLKQSYGSFWRYTDEEQYWDDNAYLDGTKEYPVYGKPMEVGEACAFGQAAINLGIDYNTLFTAVAQKDGNLSSGIVSLNDNDRYSIPSIVEKLRERYLGRLDETILINEYRKVEIVNE